MITSIALGILGRYNKYMKTLERYSAWLFLITGILTALAIGLAVSHVNAAEESTASCDIKKDPFCIAPRVSSSTDALHAATIPRIATPAWLAPADETARVVSYDVQTRGAIMANVDEFKSLANQTLNDSRGWSRLGVRFDQVESNGDFTLWLSESSQMTSFSATGCDTTYSCRVGRNVVINQDRWMGATDAWTGGGGSLADYRHMVVNHETGHWLGHGHTYCSAPGSAATVMQQQSMSLQGCAPNAWPLSSEMYSPTLGIRS